METYLRLMFLKTRHGPSFEAVCREADDSISWRRFCRVPLGARMPHATTLMKTTKRCGEATIAALNEALLAKAVAARVVKSDKVRADTTVVEANVAYPTDGGLLARGVAKMAGMVKGDRPGHPDQLPGSDPVDAPPGACHRGVAATPVRRRQRRGEGDQRRDGRHRRGRLGRSPAGGHERGPVAARAGTGASGKALALVADLERTAELLERVVVQTRLRLSGTTPDGATRVVSLHDADARPIAKGRLGKPVEFGYKAQVVDNVDVVVDYAVYIGNPGDAGLLAGAIERVKRRLGRAPRAVAADRGYSDAKTEAALADMGVKTVVIPRTGRPGTARQAVERRRGFRRLVKWRTGCEGRISHLKHGYGWNRTLFDGHGGAETWCGLGVLAHNAVRIGGLIDAKTAPDVSMETPTPAARGRPPDETTDAPAPDPVGPM